MRVEGFEFESEETGNTALKETQAISYIKSKTRMDDPDMVLKLYTALIQKNTFETAVGFAFLSELQEYLYSIPYLKREEIPLIPVRKMEVQPPVVRRAKKEAVPVKVEKEPRRYKVLFHVSLFFAIIFLLIIGGMFTITYVSGNNVNIINYENAIIDKYEKWEQELEEREQALKRLEEKNE